MRPWAELPCPGCLQESSVPGSACSPPPGTPSSFPSPPLPSCPALQRKGRGLSGHPLSPAESPCRGRLGEEADGSALSGGGGWVRHKREGRGNCEAPSPGPEPAAASPAAPISPCGKNAAGADGKYEDHDCGELRGAGSQPPPHGSQRPPRLVSFRVFGGVL